MKSRKSEILIGVFAIGGTTILMVLIVIFGDLTQAFKDRYEAVFYFDNSGGIQAGSSVCMIDVPIGKVTGVELVQRDGEMVVKIRAHINRDIRIRSDAEVKVKTRGLIANPYLNINQKPPEPPQPPLGEQPTYSLLPINESASGYPGEIVGIDTPSIDEVLAMVLEFGKAIRERFGDEESWGKFRTALANLEEISNRLLKVTGEEVTEDVRATVSNLRTFTGKASTLIDNLDKYANLLRDETKRNSKNLDELARALVDNSRELNQSLEDLSRLTKRIGEGRGSLGKLLKDDEAYRELLEALTEARKGLEDMRAVIKKLKEEGISIF